MRVLGINCCTNNRNVYNCKSQNNLSFEARFPNGMKKPRHIKPFLAMRDFVCYHPGVKSFGQYKIPVHNEEIARRLKPSYTSSEFESLYDFAKKKGTFDYIMDDKTGFIKTSFINRKENPLMSDLIWITDSCHNMELAKSKNPQDCTKILNKLTDFYDKQQDNFDSIIANPRQFKHNSFWVQGQAGVGHCFVPSTHLPHIWFARTRLESIGNYLQVSSDMIRGGLSGKNYGYKTSKDVPDNVITTISNCVKYLEAIHYPTARSCGAWEEQTFVNSLLSDTSIINKGMRDIIDLMFSDTGNKELIEVRRRILNSKHGAVFSDKSALEKLLQDGEQRIVENPFIETFKGFYNKKIKPYETKCLSRDFDAAMSFMPQSEVICPDDITRDCVKKLLMLKKLGRAIVRPNGAIRYSGDEYLNLDYHTLKNKWTDNKKTNEAEWFLVSEISSAYGSVVRDILNHIEQEGKPDAKLIKLLKIAMNGETEFINRSYARITPRGMTKSNGYSCPEYKVPEAYEAVTTPKGIKYVPGAHPLTWAESSLMKASELFKNNLIRIENSGNLI